MTDHKRRILIVLSLLGALLSILGGAAIFSQRQMRLRGTLDGYPDIGLPPRVPVLGVNADLTQYAPDELDENLTLIRETGFVWVRQTFSWERIEHRPGEYLWDEYDPVVETAAAHDLQLVAALDVLPGWASGAPSDHLQAFAAFAGEVAERYGDTIDVYQIWDEPNLSSGWGGQPADPVGYAAMLEAAYGPIHAADPDALVLAAGLAPTIETGLNNLSDVLFLEALYANGAAPYFDGAVGKPYGFDTGPADRRIDANRLNFSRFVLLREVMERHGDTDKPLWASHFGWNSLPDGWTGQPSLWGQTTPDQQAAQTVAAYRRALVEWPWAGALILDHWQPDVPSDDPRRGFALRGQDGTLSPTADAIRELADLSNAALWPGIYVATDANPLLDFSGKWEFSDLGADFSEHNPSVVDVPFAGDSLATIIRRGDYRAHLYVSIDEQPSAILPRDERGTYLVLTSPDYQPRIEAMPIAAGMEAGQVHTAHIEAERGWDQWALVGFAVGSHVNTTLYDLLIGVTGLLAVTLLALAVYHSRRLASPGPLRRLIHWLASGLSQTAHLILSLAAALGFWVGAALTWGGLIPNLVRKLGEGPSLLVTALTAGVFYYSPWLVLTLIALVMLFVLIYARPQHGVALIVFFSPYWLHPRPMFERMFSMVEVVSLVTFLVWSIRVAERRINGWPSLRSLWRVMTPLDKSVVAFVGLSLLALSWSPLIGVAITELRQMALEPAIVYLVMRTLPFSRAERWRVADLFILTGTIVAVIGLYQYQTGLSLITAEGGIPRLRSVFNSPNNVALYLGRAIPLCLAVALIGGMRWRRWAYGICGILMVAAFRYTLSKGGLLLGLPAGIATVIILWGGRWGLLAVIAGIALEGLALIPLSRLPRFQGLFDLTSGTSTSFFRVSLWKSTLRMLQDHPITGVGLDQFLYQYRGHYILPDAWQEPDLSTPHNFILSYWVRLGILGVAVGAWMQVAFWRLALALHRLFRHGDPERRALVAGLMGGMAAFIAHGLVDEGYYLIDLAFVFFMMLGLLYQLGAEAQAEHRLPADPEVI